MSDSTQSYPLHHQTCPFRAPSLFLQRPPPHTPLMRLSPALCSVLFCRVYSSLTTPACEHALPWLSVSPQGRGPSSHSAAIASLEADLAAGASCVEELREEMEALTSQLQQVRVCGSSESTGIPAKIGGQRSVWQLSTCVMVKEVERKRYWVWGQGGGEAVVSMCEQSSHQSVHDS